MRGLELAQRAGRLKDMARRSLLLKLEARGQIGCRRAGPLRSTRCAIATAGPSSTTNGPLKARSEACDRCGLQPVAEGGGEAAALQVPVPALSLSGAPQLRRRKLEVPGSGPLGRVLACLLFGSAAWKAAAPGPVDRMELASNGRHLCLLTNNTRFLILPWVRVPHLASHLLGQVAARLSADWQQKYGHPIYCWRASSNDSALRGPATGRRVGCRSGGQRAHPQRRRP